MKKKYERKCDSIQWNSIPDTHWLRLRVVIFCSVRRDENNCAGRVKVKVKILSVSRRTSSFCRAQPFAYDVIVGRTWPSSDVTEARAAATVRFSWPTNEAQTEMMTRWMVDGGCWMATLAVVSVRLTLPAHGLASSGTCTGSKLEHAKTESSNVGKSRKSTKSRKARKARKATKTRHRPAKWTRLTGGSFPAKTP